MNTKKLAKELKKVSPFPGTDPETFFALKGLLPMVAIELFILNKKGEFVLVYKKGKVSGWALPGGYLGFNENFEFACRRIAKKYLGVGVKNIRLVDVSNLTEEFHGKDNGHAVAVIFRCTVEGNMKNGRYFKKIPKDIMAHHRLMVTRALKFSLKRNGKK